MNSFKLLFALSIALNVGFVTLLALYVASSRDNWTEGPADALISSVTPTPVEEDASAERVEDNSTAEAYRRLHAALRATGLPAAEIHRILRGTALADWTDDVRQIHEEELYSGEFWSTPEEILGNVDLQRRMTELRRTREAALDAIIENNRSLDPWGIFFGPTTIPSLSAERKRQVMMLEEDYRLLMMAIKRKNAAGVALPEDLEALRLLQRERIEDLASILSPDELEEYELLNSETSRRLRHELRLFNATDEEFSRIFDLRRDFDSEFPGWATAPKQERHRQEAEEAWEAELQEALGEDRFADFQRARDPDYQHLVGLAERLGLPRDRADRVYDFRELVTGQRAAIEYDRSLTSEDRREAIELLVEGARAMLLETMGEEGYETYLRSGAEWIDELEDPIDFP